MAEYYVMKVCAGLGAGGITLAVLTLLMMIPMFMDKLDSAGIERTFKMICFISCVVTVVVPFFANSAEYHIIHNGRNYFTDEIIYLKDGGIHFQSSICFGGNCITFDDDFIIKKI